MSGQPAGVSILKRTVATILTAGFC